MVVEKLVDVIDPEKPVMICQGSEMTGIFPGKFVPSMYYDKKVQLVTYDSDKEVLKISIE